jgi:hypothetical protein
MDAAETGKVLARGSKDLRARQGGQSVTQTLAMRLTVSEAIELVGKMIAGYPAKDRTDQDYIGAIVEVFLYFPKIVAVACANPIHGVVRECPDFLPTASKVILWCEQCVYPIHVEADREKRIAQQFSDTDKWMNQTVPEPLKVKGMLWLDRKDPKAVALSGEKTRDQIRAEALARLEGTYGVDAIAAVPDSKQRA